MPWKDQEVLDHLKETYDLESEYQLQRKELGTKKFRDKLDLERIKGIDNALDDISHIRTNIVENNPGVHEAYSQKYKTLPSEPEPEGTSPLAGLLKGTKETLKFGAQHPVQALRHADIGLKDLGSLPFRMLETGVMGEKGEFPYLSAKRGMRQEHEALQKSDTEAGVTPGAGPAVAEAVGGMVLPIGPTLKVGQHLKNILKGGAFAGGISAGEELADKGDITAEQTGTAAGVGGGLTALLSWLIGRGKVHLPSSAVTREPVDVTPRRLEGPPSPGEMRGGIVYGEGPVAGEGVPVANGPKPNKPMPKQGAEAATPTRPAITERSAESEVLSATPTRTLKEVLRPKPAQVTPQAAGPVIEAKGGVVPAEPTPLAKAILAKTTGPGREASPTILEKSIEQSQKASGKTKLLTPEEAISMANEMDLAAETLKKEATLRDVISGKQDVAKVPMKRGGKAKAPKSEAPAPAVEGEVGAPPSNIKFFGEPEAKPKEDWFNKTLKAIRDKNAPKPVEKLAAPAEFGGIQKGFGHMPDYELYHLTEDIPGHPKGSTVARETLEEAGYVVPVRPAAVGKIAEGKPFEPNPKFPGSIKAPEDLNDEQARNFFLAINKEGLTPEAAYAKVREQVGDVHEFNVTDEGAPEFVKEGEIAAKVKAPFVERKIKQARARLAKKEVPIEKPKLELPRKRTEDFIKEQGYTVREREPFPGQKEYDLIEPGSGQIIARGDREQLTNALSTVPAAKGIKLYSFPGDLGEFGTMFKNSLRKAGAKVPEGVEVENSPHRAGVFNTLLRPFETPEFNVRKSEAGRTITDAGREADRQVGRRVRDLITEEIVPGKEYRPTKLSSYFSASADVRDKVNKVLVLGDKTEAVYTPEQLIKYGLSTDEVSMYQGVREALDKVVKWVKEIGPEYAEFDSRKIEGYIPRVWKGDWEIYVNGNKYLKPKTDTSSFATLSEAAAEAHGIKSKVGDAKISIKFFPDPEYLSARGLQDARVIARLKGNLERMGYMDSKTIDEAFKMGRSVKGFAKHLLERKDATGYETQDLDKVLNSYFYQAARRIEMQKVKTVAENVLKEHKADLSAGQVQYMQEYVERVAGKPAWDEIAIHQFVHDTPVGKWIDPIRGGKLISSGKELVTHLTLGVGNVGWAMINLDGLTRHVWPLLANEGKMVGASPFAAEQYMLHGIKEFFKNKPLREMLAHHGVIDIQMMSEQIPRIGHEFGKGLWTPARISLMLGTATEEFSRGVAAIARYQMALDHGATSQQAMSHAARFVEQTLGRYTRGGRPPAFTGAIGSTVGLFKTYMSVMLQNGWRAMESKDPGTIARYITGAVGVSGVLGLVPGIEDMDSAITKSTGWSPIESIEKNLPPAVATGLFSLAGVDISRRAGIPEVFPNDLRGWSGPVIGRFASAISDVANGEYGEAVLDMLPNSIRNVLAVTRGWKEGKVIGHLDKPSHELDKKDLMLHAAGITPSKEASESRLYSRNVNKEAYLESTLDSLSRKIAKGQASDADYQKFRELGGRHSRIRNEQRRESDSMVERQFRHLPRILKREQPTS